MNKGFTYIETVIAMGLLSVTVLPVFLILSQAQRNAVYAREAYEAQLYAQGILTAALDAAISGDNDAFDRYAEDWVTKPFEYELIYEDGTGDTHTNLPCEGIIVVICRGGDGRIYGRASGIVPEIAQEE